MSLRKLETHVIPGFHFYITEINSKHQSSFLSSLKVKLMLSLAILNRLKIFRWCFLMFANNWIYCMVDLLHHVNMKHNDKFYRYVKGFHLNIYWQSFVFSIIQPNHFLQLVNTITKLLVRERENFSHINPM